LTLAQSTQALECFERAIQVRPEFTEAYVNRGNVLKESGDLEGALASFQSAIAVDPGFAEAHLNRGNLLRVMRRFDEALESLDQALLVKPDYADAYAGKAIVFKELKRMTEALQSFDRAIESRPDYAEAFSNKANVLRELSRLDEAIECYDRAISIRPDYADAHSNRGGVLLEQLRLDDAIASLDRAIEVKPDFAEAFLNKSLAFLLLEDFDAGWAMYEWRWKLEHPASQPRHFQEPLWLGEPSLAGRTILLHAEQGLGDTLQFCRYARLVKGLGANVLFEAPQILHPVLGDLDGIDQLFKKGDSLPEFDLQCPLLSLPLAFKTTIATIPTPTAYLQSEPALVDVWAHRLGERKVPRIGLVWSGNPGHGNDRNRSVSLAALLEHLPAGLDYVSLQKEIREADRATLESFGNVRFFGPELKHFADTAALSDLMDIVISVDTSVAHLCGALGKPTWMLLPFCPDWRWLLERNDSPWYDSMTLYRQPSVGDWDSVFSRVSADLEMTFNASRLRDR
jgi:tetratricopeptide (TPR) repeat protein